MTRKRLSLLLALGLSPAVSSADTLCVDPATVGCFTTIQDAVTAAVADDMITVAPGVYFENVVIPAGKDGLKIQGANRVTTIVDPDVPNTGPGFLVQSASVMISNLTIRNGVADSIVIDADAAVIQRVRILANRGTATSGIRVNSGTGHQILNNEIRGVPLVGIYLLTTGATLVRGNVVSQAPYGIYAGGGSVQILSNRVSNVSNYGVGAFTNLATVASNVIENTLGPATYAAGKDPSVSSNRMTVVGGMVVNCITCSGGLVRGNVMTGSRGIGMIFQADAPGLLAQRNRTSYTAFTGQYYIGTAVAGFQNVASDTRRGSPSLDDCVFVSGSDHVLTRNTATRCGGSGFRVNADTVTLDRNTSSFARAFGFVVDGANGMNPEHLDTTLTRNRALFTSGQGFGVLNLAANTVLTGNVAARNRLDFCDQGASTDTSGGNAFASTSSFCDIP
jgi:hypothetical protein